MSATVTQSTIDMLKSSLEWDQQHLTAAEKRLKYARLEWEREEENVQVLQARIADYQADLETLDARSEAPA